MTDRTGGLLGWVAFSLVLAGCASNVSQVRTRGALDLGCDLANVSAQLTERPYVGVTRYEVAGCGDTRSYECRARVYSLGLPVGERSCKRAGSLSTENAVISPRGVTF